MSRASVHMCYGDPSLIFLALRSQIMTQTYQNPNVVEACTSENRLETLESLSDRLDATQKSLSNYLDTKRNSFPRFFFISDDELLSVLGSSDPTSIQVYDIQRFLHNDGK